MPLDALLCIFNVYNDCINVGKDLHQAVQIAAVPLNRADVDKARILACVFFLLLGFPTVLILIILSRF